MAEVICVGQAVVDCIVRGKEAEPRQKNVWRCDTITLGIGGDAVNESLVLSALGIPVDIVCGLGNDLAGGIIRRELEKHGVGTERIISPEDLATPIANINVLENGARSSVSSRAVLLEGVEPVPDAIRGAKIVSFASLFRAPLDRKEIIIPLVRAAKEQGSIVCADTKLPTWRELKLSDLAEVLPMIDYLFPNENEAAYYTGSSCFDDMAKQIRNMGVKNVIVKTGAKGCTVHGENETFSLDALPVKAVDTTGAGDHFVAGFISGLLDGRSLRECAERGTACAAICVQHAGAASEPEELRRAIHLIQEAMVQRNTFR